MVKDYPVNVKLSQMHVYALMFLGINATEPFTTDERDQLKAGKDFARF